MPREDHVLDDAPQGVRAVIHADQAAEALHRLIAPASRESDSDLRLQMHFPVSWDPYFTDTMTLAEIYGYTFKHFEHHRAQLTLGVVNET